MHSRPGEGDRVIGTETSTQTPTGGSSRESSAMGRKSGRSNAASEEGLRIKALLLEKNSA